jgi:hypothetical protein
VYTEGFLTYALFHHVDRGATHLKEMSKLGHQGDTHIAVENDVEMGGIRRLRGTFVVLRWVSLLLGGEMYPYICRDI